ncbi:TRAP transporter substrate-binding protein [Calditerrivibrio nitroreducens]|uniref:Extracellular solute-binding protein, family 7 n=1 Tax=Calditerrivibrio nitroreducens (strain DSM 19672 / NBRC 101217 / Yu37-1) TaxID=768670 RepID=E4TEH1_CALNY|nr:TRAP transporter substrate-binding protein [Calditerrivibrio nitroreducens]ADR18297.1 Extracellular solute-binding protein, family 7 [Calditerrivibrio nitroreducens DSM 19672]
MKRFLTLLFCLVFSAFGFAIEKWDMPTPYPVGNFHTVNIQKFADDVEKMTGGKIKITVHPNASLFKMGEIKRAVQTGQVQIGEVIFSSLENEDPIMGIDAVPFLATGYDEAAKLWKVSKPVIEKRFDAQGLKILFSVPWPPQGLYTKKEIKSVADLKGLKLRSYNPTISRIAELVGAQPVTIQAAELAQALATGVVNAFISSSATGVDTKSWETMTYFYDIKAWLPKNIVFVNKKVFEALPEDYKKAILKASEIAEKRGWEMSKENYTSTKKILAEKMKVMEPSKQLKDDLAKIGVTLTNDWIKKAGNEGELLIKEFKK